MESNSNKLELLPLITVTSTLPCGVGLVRPVCLAILALLLSSCDAIDVASVSSTGELSNGDSEASSLSSDGRYVAFDSIASNLVVGDSNARGDVFVRDNAEGVTTRVSVSSAGEQGNLGSFDPAISSDGRFVAFMSRATNLVPNDTNNQDDIFVHDRISRITTRVSTDSAGNESNNSSGGASISENGQFVAFSSPSTNIVPSDTNSRADVFVHDRSTGITSRVSVDSTGNQGNGDSFGARISANGRYVAFSSWASNLVSGAYDQVHIFVHDRTTHSTTRASIDSAGNVANHDSWHPAISSDGRYVAFLSFASNLVAGDTNTQGDIFVRDRNTGKTTRASVSSAGVQGNGGVERPFISGDGRYILFSSTATNLVADDTNDKNDVFVRDRTTGTTRRLSQDRFGMQANDHSDEYHDISADGRSVAIVSWATNLVAGDDNGERDIFIRAVPHVTVSSVSPRMLPVGATTTIVVKGSDFLPGTGIAMEGATIVNYIRWNETTISANVSVPSNSPAGAYDVTVSLPGTGAGPLTGSLALCAACVTYF